MTYDAADDLYLRLDVAHDAPRAAIKRAYRDKVTKVHPDTHGATGHIPTQRLNEAWAVLGDKAKRPEYDAARKQHFERQARPAKPTSAPRSKAGSRARAGSSKPKSARRPRPTAQAGGASATPPKPPWEKFRDGLRPHPTKPGYYQIHEEAIEGAVEMLATAFEKWLRERRAPSAAPR